MAKTKDGDTPSMEEILQTIRGVIAGEESEETAAEQNDDEDVLELTEMVEEDGSVTTIEPTAEQTANENTPQDAGASDPGDILNEIDQAAAKPEEAAESVAETANEEDKSTAESNAEELSQPSADNQDADPAADLPDNTDDFDNDEMLVPAESSSETSDATTETNTAEETASLTAMEEEEEEAVLPSSTEQEALMNEKGTLSEGDETALTPEIPDQAASSPDITSQQAGETEDITEQQPANDQTDKLKNSSRLISEQSATASTRAFESLLQNVPKPHVDGPAFRTGVTLEDLVIEAMKPELSAWLDKNLPTLVTQLVEKEIRKLLPDPDDI